AAPPEIIDRGLDLREVFLPDRHPGRLEDMAIALLALPETVKDRQARQRILDAPADLLKQELFLRRPHAGGRALAETEHVRLIALRVERHGDPGLHPEALGQLGTQRMLGSWPEGDGTGRRPRRAV